MDPESTLLAAIVAQPDDAFVWLALADCLEELGRTSEAELTRLRESMRHATLRASGRAGRERRLQLLLEQGVHPVVPQREFDLGQGEALVFCFIPPGTFFMGSPHRESGRYPNEGPRHVVHLTTGFWLGQTPLTNGQWSMLTQGKVPDQRRTCPATNLDWNSLGRICVQLRERFTEGFRLPTEAEWEYACRAGTRSPYHTGGRNEDAERAGWHSTRSKRQTHPVGEKTPNAWGLFDMHGNVWEWCLDALRPYRNLEVTNPVYEERSDTPRTLRGGSYENRPSDSRSACRGWARADEFALHWGARLAISLDRDDPLFGVVKTE
ncbi:MAG: SUMF1/EgtB/PvdO family nonheme iron enzyme [Gemmataceae bacterium]